MARRDSSMTIYKGGFAWHSRDRFLSPPSLDLAIAGARGPLAGISCVASIGICMGSTLNTFSRELQSFVNPKFRCDPLAPVARRMPVHIVYGAPVHGRCDVTYLGVTVRVRSIDGDGIPATRRNCRLLVGDGVPFQIDELLSAASVSESAQLTHNQRLLAAAVHRRIRANSMPGARSPDV